MRRIGIVLILLGCGAPDTGVDLGPSDLAATDSCSDKKKNGVESDVDCGGGECPRCAAGKTCNEPSDCMSGLCVNGTCAAAVGCLDGKLDGTETDIDCGGAMCMGCPDGKKCLKSSDCAHNNCAAGICIQAESCADGLKDGIETDIDCGGNNCPKCIVGKTCLVDSDCVSGRCAMGACTALALSFAPGPTYTVAKAATALLAHDLDGDKKIDLVVADGPNAAVVALLGKGDGSFTPGKPVAVGDTGPVGLDVGDLNADTRADLAVACSGASGSAGVLLGNGDGTFKAAASYAVAGHPGAIAIGDLDHDGFLDLTVPSGACNPWVSVLVGKGDGTFGAAKQFPMGGCGALSVALADLDRDGALDVVTGLAGGVAVLMGAGDDTLKMPRLFGMGGFPGLVLGDWNQDGTLDVAGTSGILIGFGDGSFPPENAFMGAPSMAAADFDLDSRLDLVGAQAAIQVWLGKPDGSFLPPATVTAPSAQYVVVGDFDGDGKKDVAAAGGTDVSIFLNTSK